ncbi:MAG TPA: IPTL-CTERM sorting domain-containing protein [Phycisphaerae bacterium]|nr:IPTL-CTERM sorting domain-containing protein [Phycisphaerae bacterium]
MTTRAITGLVVACALMALALAPAATASDPDCSKCSRELNGENWVETCAPGIDEIGTSTIKVGVSTDLDCVAETFLEFSGPFVVQRGTPVGGVIATEIVEMQLSADGGSLILRAGTTLAPYLPPSVGQIVDNGDGTARAYFEVYFQIEYGEGLFGYNKVPLIIRETVPLECLPPDRDFQPNPDAPYFDPTCIPLWDTPGDGGVQIGNLTVGEEDLAPQHDAYFRAIPTVSQWGLIVLGLLVLTAGAVIVHRRRSMAA